VDKRHAVIMYDYCDKKFKVKDLNSANGVSSKLGFVYYFAVLILSFAVVAFSSSQVMSEFVTIFK
jgi:hypothetical protein